MPAPEPKGALRLRLTTDDHWLDLRGPKACELHTPDDRDRVLARLFPDAPGDEDRWTVLLWSTGRADLPGRARVTSWEWHGAPL